MAAPISAYRNGKLNMGTPSDPKSHLIAILQTSKSVMLSRFYLDDLLPVKLPDGTDGVVGAVIIGGENEKMHNITTRGGGGRIMVAGQPARLLNDAGLNTLGIVTAFSPPSTMDRDNRTIDGSEFKTAFYLGGLVGIRYYQPEFGTTEQEISDYVAENTVFQRSFYLPGVYTRSPVNVYAFVQNDEGEYRTPIFSIEIDNKRIMMSYDTSPSFLLCGMTRNNTIYADTLEIGIGTRFYTDVNMTIAAITGGYSDGENFYSYNTSTGVTSVTACSSAPDRTPFEYITRADDAGIACAVAGENEYTIYFQDIGTDRYFYKYQSGINPELADEGYYSYITAPLGIPVRKVMHVNQFGRMTSDVYCSDI